jgi:hypothetical protein
VGGSNDKPLSAGTSGIDLAKDALTGNNIYGLTSQYIAEARIMAEPKMSAGLVRRRECHRRMEALRSAALIK